MPTRTVRNACLLAAAAVLAPGWAAVPAFADSCQSRGLGIVREGEVVRGRAEFTCDSQPRTGRATLSHDGRVVAEESCQTSSGVSCVAAPASAYQPGSWCIQWSLPQDAASNEGSQCMGID
jgi:hypothetical protein